MIFHPSRGILFLAACLLLCHVTAPQAQVKGFAPHLNAYDLREVAADAQGILWIASNGGVLRYDTAKADAAAWTAFPRSRSGGPAGNDVTTVALDAVGNLWSGSAASGVSVRRGDTGRWEFFEEVPDPRIRVIHTSGDGVYIGTQAGLALRSRPTRTDICNEIDTSCIVPSFVVNDYAVLNDTLWVGTQEGLGRFNGATWDSLQWLPAGSQGQDSRSLAAHDGTLWEATDSGVRELGSQGWQDTGISASRLRVTAGQLYAIDGLSVYLRVVNAWERIELDLAGLDPAITGFRDVARVGDVLYLATNLGLMRWDLTREEWVSVSSSLPPGPQVAGFHQGAAFVGNTVWFGNREGLLAYPASGGDWQYTPKGSDGLDSEWIFALGATKDALAVGHCCCDSEPRCRTDVVIPGSDIDGVAAFDAWALAGDQAGRFWGGTNDNGAFLLERSGDAWVRTHDFTNSSTGGRLASNSVRAVAANARGTYFGTFASGAVFWPNGGDPDKDPDGTGWIPITTSTGLSDNAISSIIVNGDDAWIGTSTALHRVLDGIVLQNFPTRFSNIPGDLPRIVQAIVVDRSGSVWAGTNDGVMYLANGARNFVRFSTNNSDLTHNNILSGALAGDGTVWFGTENGITRIDPFEVTGQEPGGDTFVLYPNPFNPRSDRLDILGTAVGGRDQVVPAKLDEGAGVHVYDLGGALVGSFRLNREEWEWDGKNINGDIAVPGLFLVRGRSAAGETVKLKLGVIR